MSSATTPRPRSAAPRRRGALIPTIVVLGVLVVVMLILAQVWTEVLWYAQLGFTRVLWTRWGTGAALFVVGFAIMAGSVGWSLRFAYRSRPVYAPSTPEQASLDQYREAIEPLRRLVMIIGPVLLGLFAGGAAAQRWQDVLLFINGQKVGTTDPQWGIDLSFYLFSLPVWRFIVSFLTTVLVLTIIGAVATHYLYGGLRLGPAAKGSRTTTSARRHLSLLGAALMLLFAVSHWLDRFSLLQKDGSTDQRFAGAGFSDVHAVIPAKAILAVAALVVAAAFIVNVFRDNWRLPVVGVIVMILSAIIIGGIYPAIVQRFQVQPNQQDAEREYIQRNIDATRVAYGLKDVQVSEYDANVTAEAGALRADAQTTAQIRLMDPQIVSPSFKQLQQIRGFYTFPDSLSVDRYEINGKSVDTVIAVRELDLAGLNTAQQNWTNQRTVYTHGFGVVAARGNTRTPNGQPDFWEGGIPSKGDLGAYEPRIYFGQDSPAYSLVGAPEGSSGWEFDYPDDASESGGRITSFPTGTVSAGPAVNNLWLKTLFALRFGDEQILFSDRVNSASQILYERNPRDRVAKVAPYLELDGRVYPAVVDGRVKWIIDGYTTTDQYPYAASQSLEAATTDSLTESSPTIEALQPKQVNYIRNSVKATVDAYDGSVDLYVWDTQDPVLRAWSRVFPTSLKPMSQISSDLMSHLRYPEDLFKVQRTLLGEYHVTDAGEFFSGNDFWTTPADPTLANSNVKQPPYYLTLRMPGQPEADFSLMSTFMPTGSNARSVLTGYLAADAEAGNTAGKVSDQYGTLRLLVLPRDSTVPGPAQANSAFTADPTVSNELNILSLGGSAVKRGNLLTLPVGGGLLYVQPVYVQATSGTTFPLLQRVLVSFGDQIGFAETLDEALNQVFGGDSGANAGDAGTGGETPAPTPPTSTPPTSTPPTPAPSTPPTTGTDLGARADLQAALADANQAIKDGQAALAANDFTAYGNAQARLDAAVRAALDAEARLGAQG